jgi:hypothetical protein
MGKMGKKNKGEISLPCLAYPKISMPIISGIDTTKHIAKIATKIIMA